MFGDLLSRGFSALRGIGSTIAREATEFAGGVIGGVGGVLRGDPVRSPKITGAAAIPEAIGVALGTALGTGVTGAIQARVSDPAQVPRATRHTRTIVARNLPTVGAAQVGTSGAEVAPALTWQEPVAGGPMRAPASALPGGAQIQQAGLFGDLLPLIPEIPRMLFGGEGVQLPAAPGAAAGTIFRVQGPRLVPRRMFQIVNPSTGSVVTYKNVGRPILYSGDFAACKRVQRVASKARRRRGGR